MSACKRALPPSPSVGGNRLQRLRRLHADIERLEGVSLLVNQPGHQLAQPSLAAVAAQVQCLPDVHGLEVRKALVGIADAFHNRQVARVPQFLQGRQVGMQPQACIEREHF
jgi:hypothetical protein